jgi:hypothetical protein
VHTHHVSSGIGQMPFSATSRPIVGNVYINVNKKSGGSDHPYDGVAQPLIPYTVYTRSVLGLCLERPRAKRRVGGILEYRMMKLDKVVIVISDGRRSGGIYPFTEWLQPRLGYFTEGRLDRGSFLRLDICVVVLQLCDDMGRLRLDTIRISPFVTRAHLQGRNRIIWIFEETTVGFTWTFLMMDCTW